jgi:hypothetical protein
MGMSAAEVAAHYDNTCTAAAELAAGEDEHGIWVAGRVMPGLDDDARYKLEGAALSGDWRRIRGSMELLAALAVNAPGFPVPYRALVAAGEPVALVAAGLPAPNPDVREARVTANLNALYANIQEIAAEQVAALTGDAPTYADLQAEREVDMLLAFNAYHPWLADGVAYELADEEPHPLDTEAFAKRQNWVAKAGGLPKFIKRISKHLRAKGMDESRAIATAVNAAKKMCSTGDLNFPGHQSVNPGSRAEACAAVAEWEKKKSQS